MPIQRPPKAFLSVFNGLPNYREIERWFTRWSETTPTVEAEGTTIIITEDTNQNASEAGITIDASSNDVRYTLKDPGVYKGRTYRIDVKNSDNTVYINGTINNTVGDFQMYKDESLIIQDNGTSWRVK